MPSDIQIAQSTKLQPIRDIAAKIGLSDDELIHYGKYKAKLPLSLIDQEQVKKSKLILVSAISPTPAGEGKTISSIKDDEGYSMHYAKDFLESFAKKLCFNLHVEIYGEGDMHHYLEAVFKALGIALDKATRIDPRREGEVPSSKGIL